MAQCPALGFTAIGRPLTGAAIGEAVLQGVLEPESARTIAYAGQRPVALRDVVHAGYSQGATMGMLMLVGHADRIPRLSLIEGETRDWSSRGAQRFARGGGKHVRFACGTPSCDASSARAVRLLRAARVASDRHHVPGLAMCMGGCRAPKSEEAFRLLTKDDPCWANDSTAPGATEER